MVNLILAIVALSYREQVNKNLINEFFDAEIKIEKLFKGNKSRRGRTKKIGKNKHFAIKIHPFLKKSKFNN